jgi:hypothetical protein
MPTDEDVIRNLIGRHAQLTDDAATKERVQLYVEDGVFTMGPTTATGHDQLLEAFTVGSAPERLGKHVTANTVVEVKGDTAEANTDFLFILPKPEGLTPFAVGRYTDTFTKVNGQWFFKKRHGAIRGQ